MSEPTADYLASGGKCRHSEPVNHSANDMILALRRRILDYDALLAKLAAESKDGSAPAHMFRSAREDVLQKIEMLEYQRRTRTRS